MDDSFNLIDNSLLDIDDKILLKNVLQQNNYPQDIYNLSIFSKKGVEVINNDYNTIVYDKKEVLFYDSYMNIWIDSDLKLLPFSNWWYRTNISKFLAHIDHYLNRIKMIDMNNCQIEESNFIAIQKWFNTYGHFLDEIICLKEYNTNNNFLYKPFISFPLEEYEVESVKCASLNYKIICKSLFDNNYTNVFSAKKVVKVNGLTLLKHEYLEKTFHHFPLTISNEIVNKYCNSVYDIFNTDSNDILFLTRGIANHLPRNLENQTEIEEYLVQKNVKVVNPELIEFEIFIRLINSYKNIIITWGSAIVNLMFSSPNTKIKILKSKSYEDESIDLFNKIINERNLEIEIIHHQNNRIEPSLIL
jgi:hypothetical protein